MHGCGPFPCPARVGIDTRRRQAKEREPERPEAAQDTRSTGEATRATPEAAARRLEIIRATGCAGLIVSDLDTKSCKPVCKQKGESCKPLQPSC